MPPKKKSSTPAKKPSVKSATTKNSGKTTTTTPQKRKTTPKKPVATTKKPTTRKKPAVKKKEPVLKRKELSREEMFPFESFPFRLEYKDGTETRVCHFTCEEHRTKLINRYKLRKGTYFIDNATS